MNENLKIQQAGIKQSQTVDVIRGVACIFVVLVHVPFPGILGMYIKSLARFAVPFFLINSGWQLYQAEQEKTLSFAKQKFRKMLYLTGELCLIHIICNSINSVIGGGTLVSWLEPFWNLNTVKEFLIFNRAKVFSSVVYYMFMVLYVYVIFIVMISRKHEVCNKCFQIMKFAVPVLLCGNLYISEISNMKWYYAGNWFFTGIPFFFLGYFLSEWTAKQKKDCGKTAFITMIAGIVLTFVEIPLGGDDVYLYLGTIVMIVPLYYLASQSKRQYANGLLVFGKQYSLKIFMIHCIIYNFFCALLGKPEEGELLAWLMPFIVIAVSVVISWGWLKLENRKQKV